jgi:hypothetical protein
MTLPSAANGMQIAFGFLVYWMLSGWAVLGETLSSDNPGPRSGGRISFLLGQAFALAGLSCLALLCAHALAPLVHREDLEFLPLGAVGLLYLAEVLWIVSSHPLPRERRPYERLEFGAGRDLTLRHGATLFLGEGLLATVQGGRTAALQAGGIVLGWGFGVFLWDLRRPQSLQRSLRMVLAPLSLLTAVLLFSRAWRSF